MLWTDNKQWEFPKDELNGDKLKARRFASLRMVIFSYDICKILENVVLLLPCRPTKTKEVPVK